MSVVRQDCQRGYGIGVIELGFRGADDGEDCAVGVLGGVQHVFGRPGCH